MKMFNPLRAALPLANLNPDFVIDYQSFRSIDKPFLDYNANDLPVEVGTYGLVSKSCSGFSFYLAIYSKW